MEHCFLAVLGKDFTGTAEAAGPGVQSLRLADTVFGMVMKASLGDGASAGTSRRNPPAGPSDGSPPT
jgi:NADPH:quinone reductase-like Zn-dependent oxidoreductase